MSIANAKYASGALVIAAGIATLLIWMGDPFLMVFMSPPLAALLSITIVTISAWLCGPAIRAYVHGTGRQSNWGYLGHTVRGETDFDGKLWVSLNDCQSASGIPLVNELRWIPERHKRKDRRKGWLVDQAGTYRALETCKEDPSAQNKLRLFLEREVWQTRRG
jgi:hypothetical protein